MSDPRLYPKRKDVAAPYGKFSLKPFPRFLVSPIKTIFADHMQLPSPDRDLHRSCPKYIQNGDNLSIHIIVSNRNSYKDVLLGNGIYLPIFDKVGILCSIIRQLIY